MVVTLPKMVAYRRAVEKEEKPQRKHMIRCGDLVCVPLGFKTGNARS